MPLLRMRDATFALDGTSVGPFTLDLEEGERAVLQCEAPRDAAIAALLGSGIVKASSGCVLIGDFDPRVQSVACKRLAALVPHEPFPLDDGEFARYVAYRAALWNLEPRRAQERAAMLRKRLAGMHEAFAFPLIGALLGMPKLVVLDRPQPAYVRHILDVVAGRALLTTHADADGARVFAPNTLRFRAARA